MELMKILTDILNTKRFPVSTIKISAFDDATEVQLVGKWKEKETLIIS